MGWYEERTLSSRTCFSRLTCTWWSMLKQVLFGSPSFWQAVCFTIMKKGTSSVMTLALDASVFVKVCVCVYLLKRSKTCIISGWWISCWRTIDWIIFTLWSSFTRFAVQYETIWHVTAGKHFVAGGQSSWCYSVQRSYASKREVRADHPDVPATWLSLTWWSCWNIGHEGWLRFSSCLLHHHETRNIFCHDFGTWCLSFC